MSTTRLRVIEAATHYCEPVCISLKHNVAVTSRSNLGLAMYSLTNGSCVRRVPNKEVTDWSGCICSTSDGDSIVVISYTYPPLLVYDIVTGSLTASRCAHLGTPYYVDCNEDALLIGGTIDVVIVSWATDEVLHAYSWANVSNVWCPQPSLVRSSNARLVYTFVDRDNCAYVQTVAPDASVMCRQLYKLCDKNPYIQQCVQDSSDGSILLLLSTRKLVRLVQGSTKLVEEVVECHGVATLPDGGFLALYTWGGFSVHDTTALRHAWMGLCVVCETIL